jgi:Lar family restriction alleviation protein
MSNARTELLPCPFCGSDQISLRYEGQPATAYAMVCLDCGGTTQAGHQNDAVPAWNRRQARGQAEPLPAVVPPLLTEERVRQIVREELERANG